MHRIDHATAAPGDLFTEGNPATATPATTVTDDWLNDMQENVCDVVEAAGIALVKGDYTQLRQAITAMVTGAQKAVIINSATFEASVANGEVVRWDSGNNRFDEAVADGSANNRAVGIADVTNSKVYLYGECSLFTGLTPGARYYLSAGTQGAITSTAPTDAVMIGIAKSATVLWVDVDSATSIADASTTVKGKVQLATSAEAQALVDALKAITPATLAAAFSGANLSLAANGYLKLPGGLIIQWGIAQLTAGANYTTITLPMAYPTLAFMVCGSPYGNTGGVAQEGEEFASLTLASFQVSVLGDSATGSNTKVGWFSLGC